MEVLMSNWSSVQSIPENYVLPPHKRTGKVTANSTGKEIPVIDFEKADCHDRDETIRQILKACQEIGLFQVVNHGVSKELMDDTMKLFKEFFSLPAEYKANFISKAKDRGCILYTSSFLNHDDPKKKEIRYWRDCLVNKCYPLEDHLPFWPETPIGYHEIVGAYSVEMRKFLMKVLDLISEGLGIEAGYFEGDLTREQLLSVNHHIPCPDPSVTLGHPEHRDPNLITAIHQCNVPGLQSFKDGQWIGVEPLPHAFVIIPGVQFRVISNEKFTSPKHRVVTHATEHRTTLGTFFIPSDDSTIEPAKSLVSPFNPPLYRSYVYRDFFNEWMKHVTEDDAVLDLYKIQD
ncbi:Hyoscyamine 6-dioxygenase [Actinidia chinensis var. chinensis]|uniref:Hyoscyamine 6-dioxygenase n=1 Tax=Actinidia chinensis var. chinensis TaxID=1590841 RepID=A0A2R6RJ71_ACTCC|nr:Hyoscyamine 6-dioxygenase [Actinidia chinensis var. chinensis]